MHIEQALRLTAGLVVGITVLLSVFHSPQWLWATGLVSVNLIQSAFTDTCPAKWGLEQFGLRPCGADRPSPEEA